jgi:hypothetical protein
MKRSFLNRMRCHNLDEVSVRGCVIPVLKSCSVICVWSNSMVEGTPGWEGEALSIRPISISLLQGRNEKREGEG